jgi:hypothetical protein
MVNLALIVQADDARPRSLVYLLIAIIGVSWSFVAAGLVAWSQRPDNRTGALMVAVGLAFALNGLRLVGTPLGFALWFLVAMLPAATLAHLIAVFPDGHPTTRLQRVFIVVNYTATVPWRWCSSCWWRPPSLTATAARMACSASAVAAPTTRRSWRSRA